MAKRVAKAATARAAKTQPKPKPKPKPPTRGFVPTDKQRERVMDMVAAGIEQRAISLTMKIPIRILQRHFLHELQNGAMIRKAQIGGDIVEAARDKDHKEHKTMAIYYSKAHMGWSDRVQLGFSDENGKAVSPANLFTVQITG